MSRSKKPLLLRAALLGTLSLSTLLVSTGCNDASVTVTPLDSVAVSQVPSVLSNEAQNVIYATYVDLDAKAQLLQLAIDTLVNNPTDANLALAQQAWRNIRSIDEADEGFLFGPVENLGVDASTDAWPLNETSLIAVLNSNAVLNKSFIDGNSANIKGFHTIEYLIFGENGTQTAANLTPRELQYLLATAQSLTGSEDQLAQAWSTGAGGGNFITAFETAGQGSAVYLSQSQALEDLLDGVIGICDEVANSKIYGPFSEQDDTLEESRFSNNSDADFENNIRSVQNIYLGTYVGTGGTQGNGQGLKALLLAQKDTVLATQIGVEIDSAISSIEAMTPTFHQAIFNNKTKVQAAINTVQTLKTTLAVQAKDALGLQ